MPKANILVIGGAGFIGSHVNKRLSDEEYATVVLDNLSRGDRSTVVAGEFIQGDIGDKDFVTNLLQKRRFDAIMHFAALTDVGESVRNPLKYYTENVAKTVTLLEAIIASHVCPIIFSSSAAVYGIPHQIPIPESHPRNPINPYGATKKTMEDVLLDSSAAYKLPYCALRYFNAAGGDPDGIIKLHRQNENNLIPIVLNNIRANKHEATIFGDDYPTKDGTCIRDYIHVMDLADAHILAMEQLFNGGHSNIYNLGNGQGYSVKEVLNAVENITKLPIKITVDKRRPGDPPVLLADASKALAELGWRPKYPSLDTMIAHAWMASEKCPQ